MATRLYLPSTGTAGASPAVDAAWDFSVSAFIRRATVEDKISSAFATISLDGNTDSNDTDYCYVQYVSDPIAAQTISAQTVDWVVSLFEENARANQYLSMCIRVVSGDGSTVRGTVVALRRDGTELGTSQSSRYDSVTSTQVVASDGDRIVIEIGTGGNPEVGAGGDSHDSDVRIGDNSATDFGESGSETSDYCGWVEFANTITFASAEITGTLDKTLGVMTGSGTGTVDIAGELSKTLGALTGSSAGTVDVAGALDKTLGAMTLSGSGTVGSTEIYGELDKTLGALTGSGAGSVDVAGVLSKTLGAMTSSGAGTVSVAGVLDKTLGALTGSGAGTVDVAGVLDKTLGAMTLSGTGAVGDVPITGELSQTLGAMTGSVAGTVSIAGVLNKTLGAMTGSVAGTVSITGILNQTLGAITLSGAGAAGVAGILSQTLGAMTISGAGAVDIAGVLGQTLGAMTLSGAGSVDIAGGLAKPLGAMTISGAGTVGAIPFTGLRTFTMPSRSFELNPKPQWSHQLTPPYGHGS